MMLYPVFIITTYEQLRAFRRSKLLSDDQIERMYRGIMPTVQKGSLPYPWDLSTHITIDLPLK